VSSKLNAVWKQFVSPDVLQTLNYSLHDPLYPPVIVSSDFAAGVSPGGDSSANGLVSNVMDAANTIQAGPGSKQPGQALAASQISQYEQNYSPARMADFVYGKYGASTGFSTADAFKSAVFSNTQYAKAVAQQYGWGFTYNIGPLSTGQTAFQSAGAYWNSPELASMVKTGAEYGLTQSDIITNLAGLGFDNNLIADALVKGNAYTGTVYDNSLSNLSPSTYGSTPATLNSPMPEAGYIIANGQIYSGSGVALFTGISPNSLPADLNCGSGSCDATTAFYSIVERNGGIGALQGQGVRSGASFPSDVVKALGRSYGATDDATAATLGQAKIASIEALVNAIELGYPVTTYSGDEVSPGCGKGCVSPSSAAVAVDVIMHLGPISQAYAAATGMPIMWGAAPYEPGVPVAVSLAHQPTPFDAVMSAFINGAFSTNSLQQLENRFNDLAKQPVGSRGYYAFSEDPNFQTIGAQAYTKELWGWFTHYGYVLGLPAVGTLIGGIPFKLDPSCSGALCLNGMTHYQISNYVNFFIANGAILGLTPDEIIAQSLQVAALAQANFAGQLNSADTGLTGIVVAEAMVNGAIPSRSGPSKTGPGMADWGVGPGWANPTFSGWEKGGCGVGGCNHEPAVQELADVLNMNYQQFSGWYADAMSKSSFLASDISVYGFSTAMLTMGPTNFAAWQDTMMKEALVGKIPEFPVDRISPATVARLGLTGTKVNMANPHLGIPSSGYSLAGDARATADAPPDNVCTTLLPIFCVTGEFGAGGTEGGPCASWLFCVTGNDADHAGPSGASSTGASSGQGDTSGGYGMGSTGLGENGMGLGGGVSSDALLGRFSLLPIRWRNYNMLPFQLKSPSLVHQVTQLPNSFASFATLPSISIPVVNIIGFDIGGVRISISTLNVNLFDLISWNWVWTIILLLAAVLIFVPTSKFAHSQRRKIKRRHR
jgi:hypothetical protein